MSERALDDTITVESAHASSLAESCTVAPGIKRRIEKLNSDQDTILN